MVYIIISIVLFSLGLFIYMYREAFRDQVKHQTLGFPDFPEGFGTIKIFFISDIHKRIISDQIIDEVRGKTDLVIIGGDLVEKGVSLEKVKENITKLKSIGPMYFVWGNNDYEIDYHELDAALLEQGVKILDNTAVSFESEIGERFVLLGVDDLAQERDRLDLALQDAGSGGFRVLVSHNPEIMSKINPEDNISLVLSGHTHGGQIRFLGLGLYEQGKIKTKGQTTLLVSNGYGTTAVPLRLGAMAETHLLTLKKK